MSIVDDDQAIRCLVRAAAALDFPTVENRAAALVEAAHAIVLITQSDTGQEARKVAETYLRAVRAARTD